MRSPILTVLVLTSLLPYSELFLYDGNFRIVEHHTKI